MTASSVSSAPRPIFSKTFAGSKVVGRVGLEDVGVQTMPVDAPGTQHQVSQINANQPQTSALQTALRVYGSQSLAIDIYGI